MGSKAYEVVTERVVELLEKGTVPWRQPWRGRDGAPRNALSKRDYRGGNAFLLGCLNYDDPRFVTFKQALELGGHVRKGERGWPVVYVQPADKDKQAESGGKRGHFLMRYSTVFNVGQCEALEKLEPWARADDRHDHDPIEAADAIARGYAPGDGTTGPEIASGRAMACYVPVADRVEMPAPHRFGQAEEYYSTLFHELAHSTGHAKRLARQGITDQAAFASHSYSREELVAEVTACFLCSEAGIAAATLDNSASYIGHWVKVLRGNPKLVLEAASAAQKAADMVLGRAAARASEEAAA